MAFSPATWQLLGNRSLKEEYIYSQFRRYRGNNFFSGANFSATLSDTIGSCGKIKN